MFRGRKVTGILLAGGSGSRFGGSVNKVYQTLDGRPVLYYSLAVMDKCPVIDDIVIVCRMQEEETPRAIVRDYGTEKPVRFVHGGSTRQESVHNALESGCGQMVVIHDGARPFIQDGHIIRCLEALDITAVDDGDGREGGFNESGDKTGSVQGSAVAVRAKDTIKLTDANGLVEETVPRERAWQVQTPQCFLTAPLMAAHERFWDVQGITDDCMLIEKAGGRIRLTEGDYRNIKITTPEDMILAESILKERVLQSGAGARKGAGIG